MKAPAALWLNHAAVFMFAPMHANGLPVCAHTAILAQMSQSRRAHIGVDGRVRKSQLRLALDQVPETEARAECGALNRKRPDCPRLESTAEKSRQVRFVWMRVRSCV